MDIHHLLKLAVNKNASDLHLSDGLTPRFRLDGDLLPIEISDKPIPPIMSVLAEILTPQQLKQFELEFELDCALTLPDIGRFRVNIFKQTSGVSAAFRIIPSKILSLEELGFPKTFKNIADLRNGLVLITGPTGSGKSTTLAAMIDYINQKRTAHIVTIEDPIEYIHESKRCLIHQREVHRDTKSFNAALRSALREDPDIILVGELRDLETVRLALNAAETGHLVFGTLHTSSAAKTINRITDIFPANGEKTLVRAILAESLQAVISQTLVKKINGGRVAALEIMLCTPAIRNLIHEDRIAQIYTTIQTGLGMGMQTLDQHLRTLVMNRIISKEIASEIAINKETFN